MKQAYAPKHKKYESKNQYIDYSKATLHDIFNHAQAHPAKLAVNFKSSNCDCSEEGNYYSNKRISEVSKQCPYNIMGVGEQADKSEIDKAYKCRLIKVHPDKGGCENDFIQLRKAYNMLLDPKKRDIYNEYGNEGVEVYEKMGSVEVEKDEFETALRLLKAHR